MDHRKLKTLKNLSQYLNCTKDFLELAINNEYYIIDSNENNRIEAKEIGYDKLRIRRIRLKKKGDKHGYRIVYAVVSQHIEDLLKVLNNKLSEIYEPTSSVHGFVSGRNIKTNATPHIGKQKILSVDIKDYFESITTEMITSALSKLGFAKNIAEWISTIATFEGRLVPGFCSSPTIANILTREMDEKLEALCDNKYIYTRYADDLYFSSNDELPELSSIEEIIREAGFQLNSKKTKIMYRGRNQYVTGLTVFDHQYPRIPKRIKRNIRLELYFINKFGIDNHVLNRLQKRGVTFENKKVKEKLIRNEIDAIIHRLHGWISYINSVEPEVASKFSRQMENLPDPDW